MQHHTYTLRGLAEQIQFAFSQSLQPNYWIRVEIHRLSVYGGTGHAYLELVEKENSKVVAKMNGTIWRDTYRRISNHFEQVTNEPFRDGLQVLMQVQVRFHELYGMSINILQVDPAYSLGQMARMRMETITALKKKGLYDANRERSLSPTLTRIAVISGASSKGYKDFIQKIIDYTERYKLRIQTTLFPALLDGQNAIETIPKQMQVIENQRDSFDAICILRGGGGEIGISAFDHYQLAVAVCNSSLPVFTGIGHSTNETVTELVAYKNGITPTDVATFIAQHQLETVGELEALLESTFRLATDLVFDAFQQVHKFSEQLERKVKERLLVERSILREMGMRVVVLPKRNLAISHQYLTGFATQLSKQSQRQIDAIRENISDIHLLLRKNTQQKISKEDLHLQQVQEKVALLDPANVLQRGYSITRVNGKAIKDSSTLAAGSVLETELFKGKVKSKALEKNE